MEKQVGIIGAGISGLLACKYVSDMGFSPTVFEEKTCVGGVWNQTIQCTKLQNHKLAYQFTDFPWPSSVKEDFPDHNQVQDYIESYATHFELLQYIRFNSKVLSIDFRGASDEEMSSWDLWGGTGNPFSSKGKWKVTVQDTHKKFTEEYEVGFVILCIGRYSGLPNIPDFPPNKGPEVFDGKVVHSMDYSAMDDVTAASFIKGKRVTVVGIQKSALDIANQCAIANGVKLPCTMIYKSPYWSIPDFSPWGVSLAPLYCNRFAEFMVHKPGEGILMNILATLLSPLRWLRSKFVESYVRKKLPLKKYNMIPKHSFHKDFSGCTVSLNPENFYDRVEEGSIILKKTTTFGFCKGGLLIDDKPEPLETDTVILATGYKGDIKLKNIFAPPTFQKYIMGTSHTVPLYRECVHPRIPQLAIIGYTESILNLFTSELRSRWVAHLLKGTFKLPGVKEMEEDLLMWERYMKKYSGKHYRRSFMGVLQIWFNDQLCKDMKCNPRRKKGVFAELFEPYGSGDYINLSTS